MQSSPRIEELRQKFHENPRRYFAPLANEYRKAGDAQQAIAICRAHLAQQPRHMSGHVVYGQALYDAGRTEEARVVFEQALALDPENVIVLRHLGDIARRNGDVHGARNWYSRALDLDPQDAEVAAYVAELTEPLISRTETEVPVTSENKQSPIITRTLAELYLQQGHVDSALEIYRQLALREPDDPSIRGRIDELVRDLEIEHPSTVEVAPATAPEPVVAASSQDDAGEEPTEAETGPLEQQPAVEEPPELELTSAQNESGDQADTAAPSAPAAEGETQEPVTAKAETPASPDEKHFSETDLSSEVWDADDFWGTEAFRESAETDQIFGLPYDSEINPEEQPASSERVAGHETGAKLSETGAPTAPGEQDVETAAAPEEAIGESATEGEITTAEPEAEAQPAPREQRPEAQTDAEAQADGDAEPQPEAHAAPTAPEPEPQPETAGKGEPDQEVAADARELAPATEAATPAEEAPEPVVEPAFPATQAAEPLVLEHEPSPTAEAPTWAGRITVREFFATLGSARAPSEVTREESVLEESIQAEAVETAPETPVAPEPEAKTEEPSTVPDDAFSRLFADSPVSPEDSRAAAALSGAVARDAVFPSADARSDQRQAREPLPATGSNEPPQESEEDLRRFREWLDGLTES